LIDGDGFGTLWFMARARAAKRSSRQRVARASSSGSSTSRVNVVDETVGSGMQRIKPPPVASRCFFSPSGINIAQTRVSN